MQNQDVGFFQSAISGEIRRPVKPMGGIRSLMRDLGLWHDRWFARREMARELDVLDDAMLRDFGMTRGDARNEAEKPFWRA